MSRIVSVSCVASAADLRPHRDARLGVEAGRRLVEEQHLRPVDEPERDVEPALHPARVAVDDAVGGVGDPDELEQLVDALPQLAAAHALDAALQHQVLAAGGEAVDARAPAGRSRSRAGPRRPRARRRGRRRRRARRPAFVSVDEHADGRRLAGAVRAEQPEDLALAHRNETPSSACTSPVALAQPLDDDRVHRGRGYPRPELESRAVDLHEYQGKELFRALRHPGLGGAARGDARRRRGARPPRSSAARSSSRRRC